MDLECIDHQSMCIIFGKIFEDSCSLTVIIPQPTKVWSTVIQDHQLNILKLHKVDVYNNHCQSLCKVSIVSTHKIE